MIDRQLVKGITYQWTVAFQDEDGDPIDFTTGTRVAYLRWRKDGASTVALTLNTDDSSEFTWTSQSGGTGTWLVASTKLASLTTGPYIIDSYWEDTNDSPTTRIYNHDEAQYQIVDPANGSF